jgi:hypothetical protein
MHSTVSLGIGGGKRGSLSLKSDVDAWNEFEDLYDELYTRFPNQGEEPWVRSTFMLHTDGQARLTFAYSDSDEHEVA